MYRINISDSGYKVLCEVVKEYGQICMEDEEPSREDLAAAFGCVLLLDDLNRATHIKDKKQS